MWNFDGFLLGLYFIGKHLGPILRGFLKELRSFTLVFDAALNEHAVERIPNQNMVMNRPYTSSFLTILVSLKSSRSQRSNGTKIVKNDEV